MRESFFATLMILTLSLLPLGQASHNIQNRDRDSEPLGYVEVEDVVWRTTQGDPQNPQRGVFSVYVPRYAISLEPDRLGRAARFGVKPGRYGAVAYSSRGKFNVVVTMRDHSSYHAGDISNTYYLEYFTFRVEPEMVTTIRGYMNPYRSRDLQETDRRNSGGYSAYWEPKIVTIVNRAVE